jgi:hypothetical protein
MNIMKALNLRQKITSFIVESRFIQVPMAALKSFGLFTLRNIELQALYCRCKLQKVENIDLEIATNASTFEENCSAINDPDNSVLDKTLWHMGFVLACEQALNYLDSGSLHKISLIITPFVAAVQQAKSYQTEPLRYQEMCIAGNKAGGIFCARVTSDKNRNKDSHARQIQQESKKYIAALFICLNELNKL